MAVTKAGVPPAGGLLAADSAGRVSSKLRCNSHGALSKSQARSDTVHPDRLPVTQASSWPNCARLQDEHVGRPWEEGRTACRWQRPTRSW